MAVATAVAVLSACTPPPLIAPADWARICEVAVEPKASTAAFKANALSDPVGGPLGGAASGALAGLATGNPIAWIVAVPLGAAVGFVGGSACAAAAISHPDADGEFRAIIDSTSPEVLVRALTAGAEAIRSDCGPRPARVDRAAPDAIVEIEGIEMGMGCAFGKHRVWASVRWRVLAGIDRRVLGTATTRCDQNSAKEFDDWFADPAQARAEIDALYAKTGSTMIEDMRASSRVTGCKAELAAPAAPATK